MLVSRNGRAPTIDPSAKIAASAHVIGNVRVDADAYVDHGAIVESAGPPVEIGERSVVLAGAVLRSIGGPARPAFPLSVGPGTLVAPLAVLTGCRVGANCYLATSAIVLQGAVLGDDVRIGVGTLVHAGTSVPDAGRIGMRQVAVPGPEGPVVTNDIERAREALDTARFFEMTFGSSDTDQAAVHRQAIAAILGEARSWVDVPLDEKGKRSREDQGRR
jgi:carbonic anhydrase/acetyltransferase-like protein (isoleucine patch superfamily)